VIGYLQNTGGRHYNLANLEAARYFYSGPAKGQWNPAALVQDKTVLVLGTGPGAVKYRDALEAFIRKTKPFVIALNKQTPVDQDLIDVRAACHPIRLLADNEEHMRLPQPLIMPASILPEDVISLYKRKEILDYGLGVEENSFEFHTYYCVSPNALVITYVLALLASGRAAKVLFAGFDGYPPGDRRTEEMDKTLLLYTSNVESVQISAITPTKYRMPKQSIFELSV